MKNEFKEQLHVTKGQSTYWLTRFVMLRFLGAIYAIAFLVAVNQLIPLIGSSGLTPAGIYLEQVKSTMRSEYSAVWNLPTVFWLIHSDWAIRTVAWSGFFLALLVMAGYANALIMALLWILYMSIVHIGQQWYGYGWELQLLETGFLSIFLCPLLDLRPFPRHAPPLTIIVLFRWLTFRIMLGSGLIKLRSDQIWRNGRVLYYHFETQPLPGPLSRWFHFLPQAVLKIGTWFNWLAELFAPWLLFWPRWGRYIAGAIIISFQLTLIISGNLSFFNWLTILPAFACFDDEIWAKILPSQLIKRARRANQTDTPSRSFLIISWSLTVILVLLSFRPAMNLLSPQQIMNTSYEPFDLVNSYGAFGTVGKHRYNAIFEGTMSKDSGDSSPWEPYIYKGLPVSLDKRPPQIAPYQLHLDWQMWFASMSTPDQYPWTFHLVWQLLHNDPGAVGLFAGNPFPDHPPRFVRVVLYKYSFARPNSPGGVWWKREKIGNWISPMSVNDPRLISFLRSEGWFP